MSFIIKADKLKNKFANVEPGLHLMKWTGVVDLGTQKNTFPNARTPVSEKVWLQFVTKEGNYISKLATLSTYEKSFFMQVLSAVLHKTPEEIQNSEEDLKISDIIENGAFLYGNIEVGDNGKVKLVGVMPAKDGETFETHVPTISVSIEDAVENIEKVPYEWLRNIIKQSEEWVNAHPTPVEELEQEAVNNISEEESNEEKENSESEENKEDNLEEENDSTEEESKSDSLRDPLLSSGNDVTDDELADEDLKETNKKHKKSKKAWWKRV